MLEDVPSLILRRLLLQFAASRVLQVVGDLMLRIQRIPDFTPKLLLVRKRLLGLEPEGITYVLLLAVLASPPAAGPDLCFSAGSTTGLSWRG